MITALLIFFALVLEYIYDPISQMKDTKVINVTFERYKTFIKGYLDNKYYVYLLFPISIMIFYSLLTYILNNYLHGFFAFILDLIILVYCLQLEWLPNRILTLFSQPLLHLHKHLQNLLLECKYL